MFIKIVNTPRPHNLSLSPSSPCLSVHAKKRRAEQNALPHAGRRPRAQMLTSSSPERAGGAHASGAHANGAYASNAQLVAADFFGKDSIVHTMGCLLRGIAPYHADPMTHLVVMLCREPLCLALTDRGLAPVRSDPSVVMLYSKMSKAQLATVQDVMTTWRMSATYGLTTQMGGGACVYELPQRCGQTFVDAVLVLYSVTLLMRSCPSSDLVTSKMLSNVVLQRILSSVVFPREVIAQAELMLRDAPPAVGGARAI